jgi:methylglutaconyl-CoA hydratase
MQSILQTVDARGVATLTLNRPDRHNAFDDALIAALTQSLTDLGTRTDVRAVILASTGRSFSAGADLAWMQRMAGYSEAENRKDAAALAHLLFTLDRLPKPTLAVVQGNAFGGGVGLVACCDIAIAAETANFALTEVRLGLTPATISPYVVRAIGPRHARRLFLTAERITAAAAAAIGLVHEVVPPAELEAARDRLIATLLLGAPQAQAEAKSLVALAETPIDETLIQETSHRIASRRASPEGREGLAAFLQKRAPDWQTP